MTRRLTLMERLNQQDTPPNEREQRCAFTLACPNEFEHLLGLRVVRKLFNGKHKLELCSCVLNCFRCGLVQITEAGYQETKRRCSTKGRYPPEIINVLKSSFFKFENLALSSLRTLDPEPLPVGIVLKRNSENEPKVRWIVSQGWERDQAVITKMIVHLCLDGFKPFYRDSASLSMWKSEVRDELEGGGAQHGEYKHEESTTRCMRQKAVLAGENQVLIVSNLNMLDANRLDLIVEFKNFIRSAGQSDARVVMFGPQVLPDWIVEHFGSPESTLLMESSSLPEGQDLHTNLDLHC